MKLLLWFRALLNRNFYNWNKQPERDEYEVVLVSVLDLDDFNVGQSFQVTSVNRTTGEITMRVGNG